VSNIFLPYVLILRRRVSAVSKDEASCFETRSPSAPQHEANTKHTRGRNALSGVNPPDSLLALPRFALLERWKSKWPTMFRAAALIRSGLEFARNVGERDREVKQGYLRHFSNALQPVMAGLVPAIHVLTMVRLNSWMPGSRPGMTK
jgi:hypothetical protein